MAPTESKGALNKHVKKNKIPNSKSWHLKGKVKRCITAFMGSGLDGEGREVREDFPGKAICCKWKNEEKLARERGGDDWLCV